MQGMLSRCISQGPKVIYSRTCRLLFHSARQGLERMDLGRAILDLTFDHGNSLSIRNVLHPCGPFFFQKLRFPPLELLTTPDLVCERSCGL
jgi:hypothetical protein